MAFVIMGFDFFGNIFRVVIILAISTLSTLLAFYFFENERPPRGYKRTIVKFIGMSGAICWMWFYCNILLDSLESLKTLFSIVYSSITLGIFCLFIWSPIYINTLNMVDIFGTLPSLSGVIFESTLALGICTILQTWINGSSSFVLVPLSFSEDSINFSLFMVGLLGSVLLHLLLIMKNGFRYTKAHGVYLLFIYLGLVAYTVIFKLIIQ